MSKYCANCGKPLADEDLFCTACGMQQTAPQYQPPSYFPEPGYIPPATPKKNRLPLVIGLASGGGIVVIALLAIMIVTLTRQGNGSTSSQSELISRSDPVVTSSSKEITLSQNNPSGQSVGVYFDVGEGMTFKSDKVVHTPNIVSMLYLYPDGFYHFQKSFGDGTNGTFGYYTIDGNSTDGYTITCTPTRTAVAGKVSMRVETEKFKVMASDILYYGKDFEGEFFSQVDHVVPPLNDVQNMGTYVDGVGNENDLGVSFRVDGLFTVSAFNKPWENEFGTTRINGVYRQDGDVLICTIREMDNTGFKGDSLTELTFRFIEQGVLEYTGEPLGDIDTGDIFTLWDQIQSAS